MLDAEGTYIKTLGREGQGRGTARTTVQTIGFLLAAVVLASAACSSQAELEFADWTFDVPEGTPVHGYPERPSDGDRAGAVSLTEDLVIGNDPDDPEASLYRPADVTTAPDGTIFIADGGAHHIKVFNPDGTWRQTLGKEGQGPGEFTGLRHITVASDLLVAFDTRNRRYSLWTLAGEHVADHNPEVTRSLSSLYGLADGTLVWTYFAYDPDRSTARQVAVHSTSAGEELDVLIEGPGAPTREVFPADPVATLQAMLDRLEDPQLVLAVGRDGAVYFSSAEAYQVLSMSKDGAPQWALRRAGAPPSMPENAKQTLVAWILEVVGVDVGIDELSWPERIPAIFDLRVDGAGRLFVFRASAEMGLVPAEMGFAPSESWPVDVYGSDGAYLASGNVPAPWDHARDAFVYATTSDANDEPVVVRYRLTVNAR